MWPSASAQIHTASHAGGIARPRMRSTVASLGARPRGSRYWNPRPRRMRRSPGSRSSTYRSAGTAWGDMESALPMRDRAQARPVRVAAPWEWSGSEHAEVAGPGEVLAGGAHVREVHLVAL